jgi:hypothetical protein
MCRTHPRGNAVFTLLDAQQDLLLMLLSFEVAEPDERLQLQLMCIRQL